MKVILSKWWNYIQQSRRGSISHCSLTGKINWDLLIHRERPPPPCSVSLSKKRSEGNLFPQQHQLPLPMRAPHHHHHPPPPLHPKHKCQMLSSLLSRCKTRGDKIPDVLCCSSFVGCRMSTHERPPFKCCFCISPVFFCILTEAEVTRERGLHAFVCHRR